MSVIEAEIVSVPIHLPVKSISPREKSLVDHYLQVKVKWKAAKLAGYSGKMQTLCQTAIDVLKKPEVASYYQEKLRESHISPDELFAELGEVARTPLDVKVQKKTGVRVADKLKAGEMLGKYLGLEKSEVELAPGELERLSDSIINGLFTAARQRQAQPAALQPAPTTSDSSEQP